MDKKEKKKRKRAREKTPKKNRNKTEKGTGEIVTLLTLAPALLLFTQDNILYVYNHIFFTPVIVLKSLK